MVVCEYCAWPCEPGEPTKEVDWGESETFRPGTYHEHCYQFLAAMTPWQGPAL